MGSPKDKVEKKGPKTEIWGKVGKGHRGKWSEWQGEEPGEKWQEVKDGGDKN